MAYVGIPTSPLQIRSQRVLCVFGIVGAHHHRCEVGRVVDHFGKRVGRLNQEVVCVALGKLNEPAVVDRIGAAVEDALPGWNARQGSNLTQI